MMNRMDVQHRYDRDPEFHFLVDMLESFLQRHPEYTPTELREAAMLAALKVDASILKEQRVDHGSYSR